MAFRGASMGFMVLFCTFIVLIVQNDAAIRSPTCNKASCIEPEGCNYGIVSDSFACCKKCAAGPDEQCGGLFDRFGPCGEGLVCEEDSENDHGGPGKCIKA